MEISLYGKIANYMRTVPKTAWLGVGWGGGVSNQNNLPVKHI